MTHHQPLLKKAEFQLVGQSRRKITTSGGEIVGGEPGVPPRGGAVTRTGEDARRSISNRLQLLHFPAHGHIAEFLAVEEQRRAIANFARFFNVDRFNGLLFEPHLANRERAVG